MPKLVDHDARRREIVEATVRVIARAGLEGATMREVAAEGGFANGAIKPYFDSKAALLRATYERIYDLTNDRVETAADTATAPREALERFCREVLPLDAARVDEARVAVAFWGASESAPEARALHSRFMDGWRDRLAELFDRMAPGQDHAVAVEGMLNFLLGAQVTAALEPHRADPEGLEAQLRARLDDVRGGSRG